MGRNVRQLSLRINNSLLSSGWKYGSARSMRAMVVKPLKLCELSLLSPVWKPKNKIFSKYGTMVKPPLTCEIVSWDPPLVNVEDVVSESVSPRRPVAFPPRNWFVICTVTFTRNPRRNTNLRDPGARHVAARHLAIIQHQPCSSSFPPGPVP